MKVHRPCRRRCLNLASLLICLSSLVGCDRPPSGQVIARVAGDDITLRDLATEVATANPPARSRAEMRGRVLAQIVDRKLLTQRARRQGLDLTPDYLATVRRLREVTLADLAMARIVAAIPEPPPVEVRSYVEAHDWMFGARSISLVDRPTGEARQSSLDSYDLTLDDARRLAAARPGDAVILGQGVGAYKITFISRKSAPLVGEAASRLARDLLRRDKADGLVTTAIEEERRRAHVLYQHSFGPSAL